MLRTKIYSVAKNPVYDYVLSFDLKTLVLQTIKYLK